VLIVFEVAVLDQYNQQNNIDISGYDLQDADSDVE